MFRKSFSALLPRINYQAFSHSSRRNVTNEPVLEYSAGSEERNRLQEAIKKYSSTTTDVPIVVGDEEIRLGNEKFQTAPFDHTLRVAKFRHASASVIERAIKVGLAARRDWEATPLEKRAEVFEKAAKLFATKYRMDLNATTMLGQGKNALQAEIDAACELIDFLRFNNEFAMRLTEYQPISPEGSGVVNSVRYRGLEGFVAAITPFNFTAIGGNLAAAPALMGNTVMWKPSCTAVLSNYIVFQVLREAGLPAGVINFIPADGPTFGNAIVSNPNLACINFTGSVPTFSFLWKKVAENLEKYRTFPRLIGECGGKNFHFVHPSADVQHSVNCTIRSAFEYQGQKCSAASRAYVPASLWPAFRDMLVEEIEKVKFGNPLEFDTLTSAVIDERSFDKVAKYVEESKVDPKLELIVGGKCDKTKGWFIEPTVFFSTEPQHLMMTTELFAPVLTIYVYEDHLLKDTMVLAGETSPFALTGAVLAEDRKFLEEARSVFKDSAGNYYENDKSTGSVVGQQPFGGARLSGTNDKAGGPHYCLRFASMQSIKTNSVHLKNWKYPFMV